MKMSRSDNSDELWSIVSSIRGGKSADILQSILFDVMTKQRGEFSRYLALKNAHKSYDIAY